MTIRNDSAPVMASPYFLVGGTFPRIQKSIGNDLETLLGGDNKNRSGSDFWLTELKKHVENSGALVTLGSATKNNFVEQSFYNKIFSKIQNILFVHTIETNISFTVKSIEWFMGLDYNKFINSINKEFIIEDREERGYVMRISYKNIAQFYEYHF